MRKDHPRQGGSATGPARRWTILRRRAPGIRAEIMSAASPIVIATRGSALALAQANAVLAQCRAAFPKLKFELKIIKTTGDKLQTASLAQEGQNLPKGLFTKELEVALLKHL